ncbi:MAG: lysylphosphatidylglycerol synthase transmembrane domain-containing protein [Candidatus Aureabacteria bacterium]|nr:lysylphosphatidylglycerol synthase transmembrane domain-containing protein [Candidatus Auribacterota bacterium]
MKRYTRAIVGVILALACLLVAFWGINFRELGETLSHAQYRWLVPAMLFVLVSMIFRAFRWQCLLRPTKEIKFLDLFSALNICFMANNFLPARGGEFIRAMLIGKKYKVSVSTVLATVVLERLFDALCVMAIFAFLLFSMTLETMWKKWGLVLVVLYGSILIALIFARLYSVPVQRGVHRLLTKFSSSAAQKTCAFIDSFLKGLNVLTDLGQVALIVMHSVFVWASIVLTYYYLCLAFDVRMIPAGYAFLVCALAVAVMAPIPGYVGSFHAVYRKVLEAFHYPESVALGCAIIAHASQYIFITILGGICLWREGVSFGKLRAEEEKVKEELGTHEVAKGTREAPTQRGKGGSR